MTSPKKLGKLARLIRSKNAGPFWLTFDIMFANDADFERVVSAKVLTKNWILQTEKDGWSWKVACSLYGA